MRARAHTHTHTHTHTHEHARRPTYVCNVRWCQPLMRKHFREMFARPVKWLPFIMNESICLPLPFTHTYGNRENEHRTTNCVRTDSTQLTGCAALSLCDKNSSITRCRLPLCGSRHNAHLHEEQMRYLAGTASYWWDEFWAQDFFSGPVLFHSSPSLLFHTVRRVHSAMRIMLWQNVNQYVQMKPCCLV